RFSLRLEDGAGKAVAASSEFPGNQERGVIVFSPAEDAPFRLIVMSRLLADGKYTVNVRLLDPEPDRAKVHDIGKDGLEFGGTLRREGFKKQGTEAKVYQIRLVKGKTYNFQMAASAYPARLRVQDSRGKEVGFGGFGGNLTFEAPEDG